MEKLTCLIKAPLMLLIYILCLPLLLFRSNFPQTMLFSQQLPFRFRPWIGEHLYSPTTFLRRSTLSLRHYHCTIGVEF